MNPWLFLILPLLGAVIGWGTNWLAVKMIFRPRRVVNVLGFRLQGLLPRRRSDLARNVAQTVEKELLSVEEIQRVVKRVAEGPIVRKALHERVDVLMNEQIQKLGPLVRTFVSSDLVDRIKLRLEDEILLFIEGLSRTLHDGLAEDLDIHDLVRERIEGFDLDRLESIVYSIAAKELRHIVVLGAVLGFLVGLVEVGVVALVS